MIRRVAPLLIVLLALSIHPTVDLAQDTAPATVAKAAAEMAEAAAKFWAGLTPEQQAKAGYPFGDAERSNWHFTPGPWNNVGRKGLPFKEMNPGQRALGDALVRTGLSRMGYDKAAAIQKMEETLGNIEGPRGRNVRDPENYFITIFGKPGATESWGWRFEGHHMAFNFTISGGKMTVGSPNFFGANPAKVPEGRPNAGQRMLAGEEDLGRKLVTALDAEQRKVAIYTETAPRDILTGEQAKPAPLDLVGIEYSKLTAPQKEMLMDIIKEYAGRLRPELMQQDMAKMEQAGMDKIRFGWAGVIEVGGPHYYRVQGPTFLIEYDNTQNNNNHIHAVWRDSANDFGEDILKKHYAMHTHPR